jgi:hypothetical protein
MAAFWQGIVNIRITLPGGVPNCVVKVTLPSPQRSAASMLGDAGLGISVKLKFALELKHPEFSACIYRVDVVIWSTLVIGSVKKKGLELSEKIGAGAVAEVNKCIVVPGGVPINAVKVTAPPPAHCVILCADGCPGVTNTLPITGVRALL